MVDAHRLDTPRSKKTRFQLILLLILWLLLLLVGIFVSSVTALMHLSSISFHFDRHPYWAQFFWMDFYWHLNNLGWWITKFGHLVGFGMLELLMTLVFRRAGPAAVLAFLFAVATEVLQIPLGRDGRLYDVYVDTCGIILFGLSHSVWSTRHNIS